MSGVSRPGSRRSNHDVNIGSTNFTNQTSSSELHISPDRRQSEDRVRHIDRVTNRWIDKGTDRVKHRCQERQRDDWRDKGMKQMVGLTDEGTDKGDFEREEQRMR